VSGGGAESFGKQWVPGDIVGVFLDLVDHTISKKHTIKNNCAQHRSLTFIRANTKFYMLANEL
jgi:hypothetical protein